MTPAIIDSSNTGRSIGMFPGLREEIVEDESRRMASNGNGKFIDGEAGVVFSINSVKQSLARSGRNYSNTEIREAIKVLRGASFTLIEEGSPENEISTNYLPLIGLVGAKDESRDSYCYVQFNFLVTRSIKNLTFRPFNYEKSMELSMAISRRLYKRLSHKWRYAADDGVSTYNIKMTTILRDTGPLLVSALTTI